MNFKAAKGIAEEFVGQIGEFCERVEITGSIRRRKPEVNDIDVVVIPRFKDTTDDTLFGDPVVANLLDKKLSTMCLDRQLVLEANGPKIKRFLKNVDGETFPIDLYIATEQSWWTLCLIRTGSREHNIKLARRALDLHMQLKADGSGLLSPGGTLIPMNSEEEIFRSLELQYVESEERD